MTKLQTASARIMLCACLTGAAALAQIQPGQLASNAAPDPDSPVVTTSPSINSEPLTVGEKYQVALQRTLDPAEILRLTLSAGINQWRDYPSEWGQGWDAFGVRVASALGQQLVRQQIQFAVGAIDHEDPRHQLSGLTGIWPRARFAIVHTFVARSDSGTNMPAYSRFIGDYGAGFISREWYPDRFHTVGQGLEAGTISLGTDVGMNLLREFWPHRGGRSEMH
jgi:hypothetical protein